MAAVIVQGIPLTASLLSRIRSSYSISEAILDQRGNFFWVFEAPQIAITKRHLKLDDVYLATVTCRVDPSKEFL